MSNPTEMKPPVAAIRHTETTLHGTTLVDDYAWLREKDNPEVIAYLEAENAWTAADLAPTAELQKTLYQEMVSHIKETDVSVPFRDGSWWYYSRTEQGAQYPIYCRKAALTDDLDRFPGDAAQEETVLDINELAKGEPYMAVSALTVSDDGHLLAYAVDNKGFRQYTLQVKDLRTGALLSERVERVGSVLWAADNATLCYTVEDEVQKRQFQFFRHTLGRPHSEDVLVFEEKDERFNLGAGRTRDGIYTILESSSHTTTENWFLRSDDPAGKWQLIEPRRDDFEYYVDHRHGLFYIRANDTGRNFRLVTTPVETPSKAYWREVLPHREDSMLEEIDLFASFFVACERTLGLQHLRILPFSGQDGTLGTVQEIAFPEPAYSAHPHINRNFDTHKFRYGYQSLVTPSSVFEYDVATGESTLLKQIEVPGGFDRSHYHSERLFATASDGTQVPVSLVYRSDRFEHGKNPLYIYGYGSYGYSLPNNFSSSRLSLLDRGFVMAFAHIRGGGDLGKKWHDAGRLMEKRNTFTDFIAVTEHLVASGYGDAKRIAMEGGSAGGLLMGAVCNLRPDLYRAVLSHVPFVDVMNTMLDASLPLTVPEYEEWGNPNEPEAFRYMLSYSPYDNVEAKAYPAMLVKTSLHDSQVMYWEPAKYIAKLRTLKTDNHTLLFHTNMTAGHSGASGRYDYLEEIAMDYAFLLRELHVEG
ncbi:S9 family peptidase [Silvibacterium dinghuense]|uniref:S9 family peptidase n=1 Tax=Silvibacterium dinghuense TaxID=1560006 RepID=A0A4Q1SGN5_9BACT|nr:S9 family peptidase [Silvibacterium dinghuense]RXS96507.1 S9 family peptidase [Silvibacterium dinghuense]GGG91366.1 oligopeptidase B [Silvibacterium dinghuense]